MGRIKLDGYICERCSHKWAPRKDEYPRVCPKCHSAWWDRKRKAK